MNLQYAVAITAILLALAWANCADGHGTPIHVEVDAGRLVVSNGVSDTIGYAPMIYLEADEDGEPFATLTLPTVGPVILWELPGLDIYGMADQSDLSIEVLARPDNNTGPIEERILWYWNPQSEEVGPSAAPLHLLGTGMRFVTLAPEATVAPPPFLLADPIAGQTGFHNHSLMKYALDNSPIPQSGVYGFFARLTSNDYAPSDPMLIVFNHGVDYSLVTPAALAINAAAADLDSLPGDYNFDGAVDAADYVAWRKTIGGNDEYSVWKENFGRTLAGAGGSDGNSGASPVPEPPAWFMAICAIAMVSKCRNRAAARNY